MCSFTFHVMCDCVYLYSVMLELPEEFVEYLSSDGCTLPAGWVSLGHSGCGCWVGHKWVGGSVWDMVGVIDQDTCSVVCWLIEAAVVK